jgi:hypothetical protein
MRRSRLSFLYLIGYLTGGGLALLIAPATALRLLLARDSYSPLLARFVGAFMLAFAVVVIQIMRHRVERLYPTVLAARVVLLGTLVWLYADSQDPLFLVLTGIVGFGMLLTGAGLLSDRHTCIARESGCELAKVSAAS